MKPHKYKNYQYDSHHQLSADAFVQILHNLAFVSASTPVEVIFPWEQLKGAGVKMSSESRGSFSFSSSADKNINSQVQPWAWEVIKVKGYL